MSMLSMASRPGAVAAIALLCTSLGAHAAFSTPYATEASFMADVVGAATDTFDDLAGTAYTGPLARAAGAFAYQAQATSGLYGAGTAGGDAWLTSYDRTEALMLSAFAPELRAVGGYFFASGVDGAAINNRQVTITVTDSALATYSTVFAAATTSTFFGITSTLPILSIAVLTDPNIENWPTLNNLVLATPVPEPGAAGLWLAGLGLIGWAQRSRRPS